MKLVPRNSRAVLAGAAQRRALLAFQSGSAVSRCRRSCRWEPYETAGDSKHEFAWSRLRYTGRCGGSFGGFGFGCGGGRGPGTIPRPTSRFSRRSAVSPGSMPGATSRSWICDNDDIFNYPVRLRRPGARAWTFSEDAGQAPARVPAQGRLPDGRRFPRHGRLGELPEGHADGAADGELSDHGSGGRRRDLSRALRHRPALPGARRTIRRARAGPTRRTATSPKWRAIRDDKGRIIVAICHNMHLGDAWEWADDAEYPEPFASMAFRVGIDYVMYSMTH